MDINVCVANKHKQTLYIHTFIIMYIIISLYYYYMCVIIPPYWCNHSTLLV